MKILDIIVSVLLIIGGLNWGLVGFFNYDLVAALTGHLTLVSRIIYVVVGLAALYRLIDLLRFSTHVNLHTHRPAVT
jgi:uncharacterized protein